MKFDTVQEALKWYFNRSWIRPPADARSMIPVKISTSPRMENTEAIMATFLRIERVLNSLPGRDYCILEHEFHRKGKSQFEVAEMVGFQGEDRDRSVRRVRDQLLDDLNIKLWEEGMLSSPKYEDPVICHE